MMPNLSILKFPLSSILNARRATLYGMLGDRIKRARKAKGLTQAALGALVGVSGSSVSLWESGDTKNLKIPTFFKVADALEVSPRELGIGKSGRGAKMPQDLRELIAAYDSSDDEYKAVIWSVVTATHIQRRELSRAIVEALIRARTPRLPTPGDSSKPH